MDTSFIFGLLVFVFVIFVLWIVGSGVVMIAKKQKSNNYSLINIKIRKPAIAFVIAFIIWAIINGHGLQNGSLILLDFCIFIFIYKFILAQARW